MANDISISINTPDNALVVSLPARLEAILYLKGKPISVTEMAELVKEAPSAIEQTVVFRTLNCNQGGVISSKFLGSEKKAKTSSKSFGNQVFLFKKYSFNF